MSPICHPYSSGVYLNSVEWADANQKGLLNHEDTSQQCHKVGWSGDSPEAHLGSFLWLPSLIRTSLIVTDGWYSMEKQSHKPASFSKPPFCSQQTRNSGHLTSQQTWDSQIGVLSHAFSPLWNYCFAHEDLQRYWGLPFQYI